MPIDFTTAFEVPFEGVPATYPHAKVTALCFYSTSVKITLEFGEEAGGEWVPGEPEYRMSYVIEGDDFTAIMTEATEDGEDIYTASKRIAYEWLQNEDVRFAGTIE